jgi:uncharacterized protein
MQKLFKYFAIFGLFLPIFTSAFTVPEKPNTYVNDYTGTLVAEQVSYLENKIRSFESNTTNEIAVVIIQSLDGDTIENIAQNIFTKWGIGKADKNNGVLLLVALDDRQARIHTGYGVEGDLTDLGTHYIQEEVMIPAFRDGNYYLGINLAVDKMIEALGGMNIVPSSYSNFPKINFEYVLMVFFIFLQFSVAILARSKSWWGGGVFGGVVGGLIWYFAIATIISGVVTFILLVLLGLFFDYSVSKGYAKGKATGVYPWWMGRGGGGFGGGGGGFGGFGGGFSGGGGSSSRW